MEASITLPSESRRVTAAGVLYWVTMFPLDSSDLGSVAGDSTIATSSTKDDEEAKNDVEDAAPPVYKQ